MNDELIKINAALAQVNEMDYQCLHDDGEIVLDGRYTLPQLQEIIRLVESAPKIDWKNNG